MTRYLVVLVETGHGAGVAVREVLLPLVDRVLHGALVDLLLLLLLLVHRTSGGADVRLQGAHAAAE